MKFKNYHFFKVIGLFILVWILCRIDLPATMKILAKSNWALLIPAVILMFLSFFCKVLRYQYILYQQGIKYSLPKTLHITLVSLYLSTITPGRLGEMSKAFFVHKQTKKSSLSGLLAGSLLDRISDIYVLLMIALFGFLTFNLPTLNSVKMPLILILTVMTLLPFAFLIKDLENFLTHTIRWIEKKTSRTNFLSQPLEIFLLEIRSLMKPKMLNTLAITFIAYLFFFGACYFMATSIYINLSFYKVSFFIACTNVVSLLPISIAGIGTREAILVYLFSKQALPAESALAFSILVFSFTYLLFSIIGAICFLFLKDK
jgi:uncharacterized protein (TIRG00374 family)